MKALSMLLLALLSMAQAPVREEKPQPTTTVPKLTLTLANFGTPTTVWMNNVVPSGNGDMQWGAAVTLRKMTGTWHAGHLHAYASSWNPEVILEYEVPLTLSGTSTFIQQAGTLPHYGQFGGGGLFYDDVGGRLCSNSGSYYTPNNGQKTFACILVDQSTGKFTGTVKQWGFDVCTKNTSGVETCIPRPDRMTQSGTFKIYDEEVAKRLKGHYVAGFGGNYSIISNGISMGFAGCSFEIPPQSDTNTRIKCTPLVGYPVHTNGGSTYLNRDSDYKQILHWDANPERGTDAVAKYGFGKYAPADGLYGMAAMLISLPGAEAFVGFGELQRGCIGYGDNTYNLPPILREGDAVRPTATDLATGIITFASTIEWPSGQMVNITSSTGAGGLTTGMYYVYWVHKLPDYKYTLHKTLSDAQNNVNVVKPTSAITAGIRPVSYCQAPSPPYPFPKATVASQGARHWIYFYDIADLEKVANSTNPTVEQEKIQPKSFDQLKLPNVNYPYGMWQRAVNGAQWLPDLSVAMFSVWDHSSSKQGRRMFFYPVKAQTPYLVTGTKYTTTTFKTESVVMANSPEEAIEIAKQNETWTIWSSVTTDPEYKAEPVPPDAQTSIQPILQEKEEAKEKSEKGPKQ